MTEPGCDVPASLHGQVPWVPSFPTVLKKYRKRGMVGEGMGEGVSVRKKVLDLDRKEQSFGAAMASIVIGIEKKG